LRVVDERHGTTEKLQRARRGWQRLFRTSIAKLAPSITPFREKSGSIIDCDHKSQLLSHRSLRKSNAMLAISRRIVWK